MEAEQVNGQVGTLKKLCGSSSNSSITWRSARRSATDKAFERGGRPSEERGKAWRIGMESLRDLKSRREEELERTLLILRVSWLNAPTNSTTILPPGCSGVAVGIFGVADAALGRKSRCPTLWGRSEGRWWMIGGGLRRAGIHPFPISGAGWRRPNLWAAALCTAIISLSLPSPVANCKFDSFY